ncbi:MAG: hypothetical protein JXL97_07055, partial [Bacteroidales bacterium]|nr:hypothetical protein [Bacteroidales bacterium]
MNVTTENCIDFMSDDLQNRGLAEGNLLYEMIDHICCLIEPDLSNGITFNVAYNKVIDSLDDDIFRHIQHETNLSTNLKFQKMKKLMYISGVFGTLIMFTGIIFKINHWPGASISILFGALILVLLFLPVFFYISHKEQQEKKSILFPIVGYLTIAVLIVGPLFKIMHWPGAGKLLLFGPLFLAMVFLPIYLVQVFKKAKETKTNFAHIIIIVGIGVTSMLMLATTRVSYSFITNSDSVYTSNINVYKMVDVENKQIVSLIKTNDTIGSNIETAEKIMVADEEIHVYIDEIRKLVAMEADGKKYVEGDLINKSKPNVFSKVLKKDQIVEKLIQMIIDYRIL